MTRLLLTGGKQRSVGVRDRDEWHMYCEARVVELDTETGDMQLRLRYVTPPELCPDEQPSIVFKAGVVQGGRLLVVCQTEVLEFDTKTWKLLARHTQPCFNDLHHATWIAGRLHVVSTGLDSLMVLGEDGEVEEVHHALGEETWQRFDPRLDYRKVATTKPHASHPNYVFRTPEGTWLTRFLQSDVVLLGGNGRRIEVGGAGLHDGLVENGQVWLTAVDGRIIQADPRQGRVLRIHDLNRLHGKEEPLGWTRGILRDGPLTYVGFSRIRHTPSRQNLAWLSRSVRLRKGYKRLPTRVAAYDLEAGRQVGSWDVEPMGLNAIFSILPADA